MRALAGIILGAALLAPALAHAQGSDTDRARALFDEAGALERQGKWGAAQDRLRQALKLKETPQLYYALGWALENDDKLLEARAEYEKAVSTAAGKPNAEEAAKLARERLTDLEKMTPTVRVHLNGGAKSGVRVLVDGREAKREDDIATIAVNPGSHVLRVERSGVDETLEQMVYVGRGTQRDVDIEAPAAVAARDSSQDRHASLVATTRPGNDGASIVPWVVLGGSAALLLGGTGLLVASSSDAGDRDTYQRRWCVATACNGTTATRPETQEAAADRRAAEDAADSGNTKQVAGFVLGGVGILGAAVGTYLLVTRHREAPATVSWTPGGAMASFRF